MAEMVEQGLKLLHAGFWPAVFAFITLVVAWRGLPGRQISPWMFVAAFAAAYCLGHALAAGSEWTLRPTRNWHWMFYLAPLACIAGVISTSPRANWFNRCFLVGVLAILTAGLLTDRPGLWASRPVCIVLIFSHIVASWAALEPLAARVPPGTFAAALALVAAATGAMIAEQSSLTDGATVMSAAGALAGIAAAIWLSKSADAIRGLAVPFVVTVGGWAWVEALRESRLWPLVLIPVAAAGLWIVQAGPFQKLRGIGAVAASLVCTVIAVVIACGALRILAG